MIDVEKWERMIATDRVVSAQVKRTLCSFAAEVLRDVAKELEGKAGMQSVRARQDCYMAVAYECNALAARYEEGHHD